MEELIKKALLKAELVSEDETGFVAKETCDGMVIKIWYRTIGDSNELVKYEVITQEQWDWERAGCKNAEDWRAYLNKCFWRGL